MPLTWLAVSALAVSCAPTVAPSTMVALTRVESGFDPLAIGVNGARREQLHPGSLAEAVAVASRMIAQGENIDLGLGQINSRNLPKLGLTIVQAFDACANLQASGRVLQSAYRSVSSARSESAGAVLKALSIYNTGRPDRGFSNGYVARVFAAATGGRLPPSPALPQGSPALEPPTWDVFARSGTNSPLIFTSSLPGTAP